MAQYSEKNYSIPNALSNIGKYFWKLYRDDLRVFAADRTRTDIPEKIHREWDSVYHCVPRGTDIRIEWACAIYDHGDWEKSLTAECPAPQFSVGQASAAGIDPRRRYPAEYRCESGVYVRSVSELCIANWLFANRIPFEYERQVRFPKANAEAHCDFYLPDEDVYLEFWGMSSDPAYLKYKEWKEPLYAAHGYKLASLYPPDLKNLRDRLLTAVARAKHQ